MNMEDLDYDDVDMEDPNAIQELDSGLTEQHQNRSLDREVTRKRTPVKKQFTYVALFIGLLCILQASLNISLRLYLESPKVARDHLMAAVGELAQRGSLYFNHRLYFVSTAKRTWTDSRDDCLQRNAHLVVINSIEEQEFVSRLNGPHWIGLSDRDMEGTWKWENGTSTSSFWGPGEPGDKDGEEDCVVAEGSWSDARCDGRHYWICEKAVLDLLEDELNKEDACGLTLDPDTAHGDLSVSEDEKTVTRVDKYQSLPDHPDRFITHPQLLCRERLTDRCYWEVEWRGVVNIAVSYRGIPREGNDSRFASNTKSWVLYCDKDAYAAWYNDSATAISLPPSGSNRVRVYVDRPAGTVSYYRVTPGVDPLTHIYTFKTFTTTSKEELVLGFALWSPGSSMSLRQSPARV